MYVNIGEGKKAAMPRYYKDKIYSHAERSQVSGYQKGEMEKRFHEAVQNNSRYGLDQKAAVEAAFRRVEMEAVKTKI